MPRANTVDSLPGFVDRIKELSDSNRSKQQITEILVQEFQVEVTRNMVSGLMRRASIQAGRKSGVTNKSNEVTGKNGGRKDRDKSMVKATPSPKRHGSAEELTPTKSLVDLNFSHDCCWPIGDPKRAGFGYCGRSSNGNRYCSFHSDVSRRVVVNKPAKLSPKHLVRVPGYLR